MLACDTNIEAAIHTALEKMINDESSTVTVYYGEDIDEGNAQALLEGLAGKYDGLDIELAAGGQPVYYYIISME